MSKGVSNADRRYYERQSLPQLRELEAGFSHSLTMPEAIVNAAQCRVRLRCIRELIAKKEVRT